MSQLAYAVTIGGAVWVLGFILLGGQNPGRSFYASLADSVLGDAKGGVPVLHIALPVLLAGSFCTLLLTRPTHGSLNSRVSILPRSLPTCCHRWVHRVRNVYGDRNFDLLAIMVIFVPCLVYLLMTIRRHLHGKEVDLDEQIMETGNAFGMLAEVTCGFFLIPVARQGSILKLLGWSPARAVRLHIWAGRILILASLIHGGMHMARWKFLAGESIWGLLIPPKQCWTLDTATYEAFEPVCVDGDTDCSCYDHFRNLTGFLSGLAMLIILLTSHQTIRRRMYRLFYMSHVLAAPLCIIMLVLHWNRSILYIAPSLLYYLASSVPVWMETVLAKCQAPVKIVSVERIGSSSTDASTSYLGLTMEATDIAVQRFRPGYYVKLLAPELSSISHPFTVNKVPGNNNQLCLIFKVAGTFTSQLATLLSQATTSAMDDTFDDEERQAGGQPTQSSSLSMASVPKLQVHGYVGSAHRVGEVLQHDVAVMIAGGIGITPYLSLLHEVYAIMTSTERSAGYRTKRVVLLWICRDASLVEYVKRRYFEPLIRQQQQQSDSSDFKVKIVVYHTGHGEAAYSDNMVENPQDDSPQDPLKGVSPSPVQASCVPFHPSSFSPGSSAGLRPNLPAFLAFLIIAWGGLVSVWHLYNNVQDKHQVYGRIWGLMAVVVLALLVSLLVNLVAKVTWFQRVDENEVMLASNAAPAWGAWSDSGSDTVGLVRSSSIELEPMNENDGSSLHGDDDDSHAVASDSRLKEATVAMEEIRGSRPTVHQMLKFVDQARCPGLFTCGPAGLMQDIREQTEERCMMRIQHCLRGASHHIAVYEEAFDV